VIIAKGEKEAHEKKKSYLPKKGLKKTLDFQQKKKKKPERKGRTALEGRGCFFEKFF